MSALLQLLAGPEWSQVVKTLLHSLWQGALIAVALALAMRRVINPHWRYRISLTALAAIPVAGIITWAALNASNRPLPVVAPPPVITEAAVPATALSRDSQTKVVLLTNHSSAPPATHWTAWLALLWIIGARHMLGRAGIKVAGGEQLRRSSQPLENPQIAQVLAEARRAIGLTRKICVAVTDKLTSPAVEGVLVPTLILPLSLVTTLTPEQIRFILLHELAHIRRGDYFANLFQLFVEALLFFNPAVWWFSHQVRREREACCDALAIELSGAPADYARTLVHVAENVLSPTPASATAFGGDREPSSLADRVQRLLVPGYRPSLRLTWRAMIGAFVLGAALLVLSAEGTRVAVAQIAKSTGETKQSTTSPQSKETLPFKSMTELSNHFSNDFDLGESSAPGYVGQKISSKLRDSPELERVKRNLKDLRFKLVSCSNKPLAEFFRELAEESQTSDSEGNGFRFSILPIRFSLSLATINPPLTNANLLEILAAIQGIPRLELAGINANGRVTLSPGAPSTALDNGVSPSELQADQQKPHGSNNRSAQTSLPLVQVDPENYGGVPDWDVNVANTLPLPALRLNRVPSAALSNKVPFLFDLPWVGKLFTSSQTKSGKTDFVQLSQLSTLNKEIRSEHNITDSLSIRFQDTATGNDLVLAHLDRQKDRLAANDNVGAEFTIGGNSALKIDPYNQAGMNSWELVSQGQRQSKLGFHFFTYGGPRAEQTNLSILQTNSPHVEISGLNNALVEFYIATGKTVITNGGLVRFSDTTVRADSIQLDQKTGNLVASGNVRVERPNFTNATDRTELNIYSNRLIKVYPKINIKARFVEVPASQLEAFVPDLVATMKPADGHHWTGVLTEPQMNQVLQRLEMNKGISLLSDGEVTTASGRQAQMQTVEIKTIVTDINPKALMPPGITSTNKDGSGESLFITTTNLSFGTTIDIVPALTSDGYNVALTVIPRMTEFLGYDGVEHPTNTVAVYENGKKGKTTYPLPRFRTQQITNSAVVRDGMTLMLAFPPVQKTITTRDKVPVLGDIPGVGRLFRSQSSQTRTNILFVLVTPTIVAPVAKQSDTSATNKDGDAESFVTSTNLRPVIDYYDPR